MGIGKTLWYGIRPNFFWYILASIFGSGVIAALLTALRIAENSPVTTLGAAIIFLLSLLPVAVGIAIYLAKERRQRARGDGGIADTEATVRHRWIMPVIGIAVTLLFAWNALLQRRVRHLEAEMIRYGLPRQLTKEQIEAFGKYLSSHSEPHEVRIKYFTGDTEAQRYASDFSSAFRAGNWLADMIPIDPTAITCNANPSGNTLPFSCSSDAKQMIDHLEGGSIWQTGPNLVEPAPTIEGKLHPPPELDAMLSDAVKMARIEGIDVSYTNNSAPLDTITVFIGHRRRDKWGVLPPDFARRLREDPSHDISDDDF